MVKSLARSISIFRSLKAVSQSAVSRQRVMPENEVVRLTANNFENLAKKGAEALKSGNVIAVPTDTVYGLAADAQNNSAIASLYKIKSRDILKPIAICVSQIREVYSWGKVTVPLALLQDFLPGPVTLVFERTPALNPTLNPGTHLVGIRIPDYPFIQHLAELHQGPIALTSANASSEPSTLTPEEFQPLWPSLRLVFDGGNLAHSSEDLSRAGSTVIDLSCEGYFRIIRRGTAYASCKQLLCDKYNLTEVSDA